MRCLTHKKELIGNCTWCGKQLCLLCIAKKEGKKIYCERCATQLAGLQRVKLPRQTTETQQETAEKQMEPTKKRSVLSKDGYIVIEQ